MKALFLTDHWAPYNIPALSIFGRHRSLKMEALVNIPKVGKHSYWPALSIEIPSEVLRPDKATARFFDFRWRLFNILRKGKYDVIIISGYLRLSYLATLAFCFLTHTPYVWCIDSILRTPRSRFRKALKSLPVKLIARNMGAAWVPGKASVAYLKHYGISEEKVFQGCYCMDTEFLSDLTTRIGLHREELRAQMGYASDERVFLFVGRMIPERGLITLIDAWAECGEARGHGRLVLIGEGPEGPVVKAEIARLNLQRVTILPPVPPNDLVPYFVACDVYVHPSISETYSLTTAQAALSAKPIIASDQVGATEDYVVDKKTGFIFKAGDARSLKDALEQTLNCNCDELLEMGRKALALALPRTPTWAAGQLERAIQVAAGKSRGNLHVGQG